MKGIHITKNQMILLYPVNSFLRRFIKAVIDRMGLMMAVSGIRQKHKAAIFADSGLFISRIEE